MSNVIIMAMIKAFGFIFLAGIIHFVEDESSKAILKTDSLPRTITLALLGCLFITVLGLSVLGTHKVDCEDDPIRGTCSTIRDYNPSKSDYVQLFVFLATLFLLPTSIGINKGYKERKKMFEETFDVIFKLISSSRRPMPAYYTSDYDKSTGKCERQKTLCIPSNLLTPADDYALSNYAFTALPNSESYKIASHNLTAVLMTGEDILAGTYLATRSGNLRFADLIKKNIILENLKNFKKKGFPSDDILNDSLILKYFEECKKFGCNKAKSPDYSKLEFSGLSLSDKKFPFYQIFRSNN